MKQTLHNIVKVPKLDFDAEYMVVGVDHFVKATHTVPLGFFQTQQEAEDFLKTLTFVNES